jgi:hypothetical protein
MQTSTYSPMVAGGSDKLIANNNNNSYTKVSNVNVNVKVKPKN